MYLIVPSYEGTWGDGVDPSSKARRKQLRWGAPAGTPWSPIEVEWALPMVPLRDIANFLGATTLAPDIDPGVRTILERTGELVELAGEGAGWNAFRPFETVDFVDEHNSIRPTQTPAEAEEYAATFREAGVEPPPLEIVQYRMLEDRLVPNTVMRCRGLTRLVAIEDESPDTDLNDPAACGFRAWVKHHGVTGVVFKKVWDSTNTVDYNPSWFYDTLEDEPYDWD